MIYAASDFQFSSIRSKYPEVNLLVAAANNPQISMGKTNVTSCNFGSNTISLSPSDGTVPHKAIQSILFELGNLAQRSEFNALIDRSKKLSPNEFVEAFERLEHKSALVAKRLLRGIFHIDIWPEIPMVYTSERFEPHYMLQQTEGHSQAIWDHYKDRFNSSDSYTPQYPVPAGDEKKYCLAFIDLLSRGQDSDASVSRKAVGDFLILKQHALKTHSHFGNMIRRVEQVFADSVRASPSAP